MNRVPTTGAPLDRSAREGEYDERIVPMTTLDAVIEASGRRIDLVKLDAEGSELDVLEGAGESLDGSRPDVVMEVVVEEDSSRRALSWLEDRGYRIFDLTPDGPVPADTTSLANSPTCDDPRTTGTAMCSHRRDRAVRWTPCAKVSPIWTGPGEVSRVVPPETSDVRTGYRSGRD